MAGPDQLLAAELPQELVKHFGVGLILGRRPFGDALAVAPSQRLEGRLVEAGIVLAHQLLQPVPFFVRRRQKLVGLRRRAQKRLNCFRILLGPGLAEGKADHGHLALGAKLAHHVLDPDQLGEAGRFEPRGIGPKIEHGIELALLGPFGEKRRRAEFLLGLGSQIEIGGAQRIGHEQEPALVERTSGHAKPLALKIAERLDGRIGGDHDGAERRSEG